MSLVAVVLLIISILMMAVIAYRKENRYKRLTFGHAALLLIDFGVFLSGVLILLNEIDWKWALFAAVISWLGVMVVAKVSPMAQRYEGGDQPMIYSSTVDDKVGQNSVENIDPPESDSVGEVNIIEGQHSAEIERFWESTSPKECANLLVKFLDILRRDYPKGVRQIHPDKIAPEGSEMVKDSVKRAYILGYMHGKGWVSENQLADIIIVMGDYISLAVMMHSSEFRHNEKRSETAFPSGLSAVAALGHLKAKARP